LSSKKEIKIKTGAINVFINLIIDFVNGLRNFDKNNHEKSFKNLQNVETSFPARFLEC
jgi:hypothetical protein